MSGIEIFRGITNSFGRRVNSVLVKIPVLQKIRALFRVGILAYRYPPEQTIKLLRYLNETLGGFASFELKLAVDSEKKPWPWYTYPAIEYLEQFDFSNCSVFEYGSGNSSRYWVNRARTVKSVESDAGWYETGRTTLAPNQELSLAIQKNDYVNSIHTGAQLFDVIVIDGVWRFDCAREAIKRIKPDGLIILDNSDWYPKTAKFLCSAGFSQVDFIGLGPVNAYAWCTSFLFRERISIPRSLSSETIRVRGGIVQQASDETGQSNEVYRKN